MKTTDFELKIISAEKIIFNGKVTLVTLSGTSGSFSILSDHAPLMSSLTEGVVVYETGGTETIIDIRGGFVEVNKNIVSVCIE